MPLEELRRRAAGSGADVDPSWGPGKIIFEIYEKTTEPNLWGPVFVTDYPKEVSPLARDHRSVPGLVERFEASRCRPRVGQCLFRADGPRRAASQFRGASQGARLGRRRGHAGRRGLPSCPRVRPTADGRARHRHRPSGDVPDGFGGDPGRDRFPHAAARSRITATAGRTTESSSRRWASRPGPRGRRGAGLGEPAQTLPGRTPRSALAPLLRATEAGRRRRRRHLLERLRGHVGPAPALRDATPERVGGEDHVPRLFQLGAVERAAQERGQLGPASGSARARMTGRV